jgi:hypothetical protein
VACVSVALVLVPQALAYATIAGLDPVHGLYAAAAAPLAAALLGSSPLHPGRTDRGDGLLTLGALGTVAQPNSVQFALLAACSRSSLASSGSASALLGQDRSSPDVAASGSQLPLRERAADPACGGARRPPVPE